MTNMVKQNFCNIHSFSKALAMLLWIATVMLLTSSNCFAIGTSAGQVIQNQATATYIDQNKNEYIAQSNMGTIKVTQIYSASLGSDHEQTGAPGQSLNFPHTLRNTGNGKDTYTINLSETVTGQDDINFEFMAVYYDKNHNGIVNDGEDQISLIGSSGTIDVEADQEVCLVVMASIPGGVATDQVLGFTLEAVPTGGTVDDITTGNGFDATEGTNEDKVRITSNAVLKINKGSTYNHQNTHGDISDDTITYVITVTNTGQNPAYNLEYRDVLDLTKFDIDDVSDIVLVATGTNESFSDTPNDTDEGSQSGTVNEDTIEGFAPIATNDVNNDGVTGDYGIRGHDDVLPINTTISFTYTVPIKDDLLANDEIHNFATVIGDVNDDGDTNDEGEILDSNTTIQIVEATYAVRVDDTGKDGAVGQNDGGDDDNTVNDVQQVNVAASGEQVLFYNTITNQGNVTDVYELIIDSSTNNNFPVGTVFSFWNPGGTAFLDSNGDGSADTGPLGQGESIDILVKAKLPSGAYDGDEAGNNGPFNALLTVQSASNGNVSDTVNETLMNITAPACDLSNNATPKVDSSDNNPAENLHEYIPGSLSPVQLFEVNVGSNARFYFSVENDSGVPDSFRFSIGCSWDGTTLGPLPDGWSYVFHDDNDNVITNTPAIPGGESETFHVHIFVPSDATKSPANYIADINGDGTLDFIDGNNDTDGDYAFFFRVESLNTGASDIKMDAVDVNDIEDISIVPNQAGQIQPGGSINYIHTLRNDGNTIETFTLSGLNSLKTSGWGNSVLVDTTGNGTPDTPFSTLTGSDNVYYINAAGETTFQGFGNTGLPDSASKIVLRPGEQIPISAVVYAPSSAPDGTTDVMSITALFNKGANKAQAVDQSTVILGQLRLVKTLAPDLDCNGVPDENLSQNPTTGVPPNGCVVWQVVVSNAGTALLDEVIVRDTVPAYTTYEAGSMVAGFGDAGLGSSPVVTLDALTDADDLESHQDGYFGKIDNETLFFYMGENAQKDKGGSFSPGDKATLRFSSRVK